MNNSFETRENTLNLLTQYQKNNDIPLIIQFIKDSDPIIRAEAIMVLGKTGNKELYSSIIQSLNDPDQHVRFCAAEALGNLGSEYAINALISAARENSEFVRCRAINALGKIHNAEATKFLIEMLFDPCETVNEEAGLALEKMIDLIESQDILSEFFRNDINLQKKFEHLYKILQIQLKYKSIF